MPDFEFLRKSHAADFPKASDTRKHVLFTKVVRELDPLTRDLDYAPDHVEEQPMPPSNGNAAVADLEAAIARNVRSIRTSAATVNLDDLASLMKALTYGEMMELAEAITKREGYKPPTTEYELAGYLHVWSKERAAASSGED